jgi:hypothetical protein
LACQNPSYGMLFLSLSLQTRHLNPSSSVFSIRLSWTLTFLQFFCSNMLTWLFYFLNLDYPLLICAVLNGATVLIMQSWSCVCSVKSAWTLFSSLLWYLLHCFMHRSWTIYYCTSWPPALPRFYLKLLVPRVFLHEYKMIFISSLLQTRAIDCALLRAIFYSTCYR